MNNKGAHQPTHTYSIISIFGICCLFECKSVLKIKIPLNILQIISPKIRCRILENQLKKYHVLQCFRKGHFTWKTSKVDENAMIKRLKHFIQNHRINTKYYEWFIWRKKKKKKKTFDNYVRIQCSRFWIISIAYSKYFGYQHFVC